MTKNNTLSIVTIGLLSLNLLHMNVKPDTPVESVEIKRETVTQTNTNESVEVNHVEEWKDPLLSLEIKALEYNMELTESDVYNLIDNDGLFDYLPVRAFKAEHNGLDYFYLSDSAGSIYISFDDLVDGGNYILEVGIHSNIMYRLEEGYYNFSEEYEEAFKEFRHLDEKGAKNLIVKEHSL